MRNVKSIFVSLLILALCFVGGPVFAQEKVNLNTATMEQLVELKNIGEAKAQKIITYRNKHKFTSVDQLVEIKGIGEKILADLRGQLTVEIKKK